MRDLRFVVIGAGMAGILSAIKLTEAGYRDLTVYEKADRLGGTWRENTYPGVCCDVPSHLYRYSFAPNPEWSRVFSPGTEIWSYLAEVAKRFDVERYVRYNAEVTRMEFIDGRWHLELADHSTDEADVVIAATGVLHHPRYPDIEGIDDFAGAVFHSARWDHSVALEGKRVGVIGTGSTAVQITSALAGVAGSYHLFQRTAQWVLPVPNPEITEEDKQRFRGDPQAMEQLRAELGQTFEENFANAVVDADSPQVKVIEQMCEANLETVRDRELREKLRPDYKAACKRLVVSPDFYEAIQRPNTHLETQAIQRVEAGGVRLRTQELVELDVLVLATGFRVDRFLRPIEVIGRDGTKLDEVWASHPVAYYSISIPDFPNLFMLNGPNGPVGNFSLIDVAELQWDYIAQLISCVRDGKQVAATREATDRLEAERVEASKKTIWVTGCRSWYLDERGIPAAWPWRFDRFREAMAAPDLTDYELR